MKLITPVEIPDYPFRLDHHSGILMLGSCFTDNIGMMLDRYLFPVEINPFGTIFNPHSVLHSLEALLKKEAYGASDLEQHGDQWLSFDHYTGFSDPDREQCLEKINGRFIPARKALHDASVLILSWGTAWIYRLASNGQSVSNCHKIPAKYFTRTMLTPEEITESYVGLLKDVLEMNPGLRILLTVSPVRHLKDGAHGNQLSKATLLLATDELVREFPGQVFYFPSYEIVMDELRDYRFYGQDMAHLSDSAIAYIWDKFSAALVEEQSMMIIRDLKALIRLREHRPSVSAFGGPEWEKLQGKMQELKKGILRKHPFLEEKL